MPVFKYNAYALFTRWAESILTHGVDDLFRVDQELSNLN